MKKKRKNLLVEGVLFLKYDCERNKKRKGVKINLVENMGMRSNINVLVYKYAIRRSGKTHILKEEMRKTHFHI